MERTRKNQNRLLRRRRQSGSILAEGVAGSVIFTMLGVVMFVFFTNMIAQLTLQAKVAHIADQTAQATDEYRFWLGQPRPGFDNQAASDKATLIADLLAKRLGLGGASATASFSNVDNIDMTEVQINVNAAAKIPFRLTFCGFDFASLFPGNVSAVGIAGHAKVQPYAIVQMDAPHMDDESITRPLGFNERDVAVIPVYGFFNNETGVSGAPTTGYGKGLAPDLTPENEFSLNHYYLKKEDIEHVQNTGGDVAISGWYPTRRIDNQAVTIQ